MELQQRQKRRQSARSEQITTYDLLIIGRMIALIAVILWIAQETVLRESNRYQRELQADLLWLISLLFISVHFCKTSKTEPLTLVTLVFLVLTFLRVSRKFGKPLRIRS